jgi:hypothetical protein
MKSAIVQSLAALAAFGTAAAQTSTVPTPPPRPPEFGTAVPASPGQDATRQDGDLPDDERSCREGLAKEGAIFTPLPSITGAGSCGTPFPLELTALSRDVAVSGKPVMTCRMAMALSAWVREGLAAAGDGAAITAIDIGTSYECRGRNHDEKAPLSEHAFANAVDIAGFRLRDGRTVAVGSPTEAPLQQALRQSACKAFMTVLGPGSPGHGAHWHFDMRQRRNDYRICQ